MKYDAQQRYDKIHTTRICGIKLNLKTEKDIIDKLRKELNKQGYIKNLIRKDLENNKKTVDNRL